MRYHAAQLFVFVVLVVIAAAVAKEKPTAGKSEPAIQWGKSVDGLRLGIRPAPFSEANGNFRHGDQLRYEVWLKNLTDKTIHINRDPSLFRRPASKRKTIDLMGAGVMMSFSIPPEAWKAAILSIAPMEAKKLPYSGDMRAILHPVDSKHGRNGSSLYLKPDDYSLKATTHLTYYAGGSPSLERSDGKSVRLESATQLIKVLPAARFQIRRIQPLTKTFSREKVSRYDYYRIVDLPIPMSEPASLVINDWQEVLIDGDDVLTVDALTGRGGRSNFFIRLTKAATQRMERELFVMSRQSVDWQCGFFLDGELIGAGPFEWAEAGERTVLAGVFTKARAERFAAFVENEFAKCHCQTAWSSNKGGLKLGARLFRTEVSDGGKGPLAVKYFIKNDSDSARTIKIKGLGKEEEAVPLKAWGTHPLADRMVGAHLGAGQFRVTPELVARMDAFSVRAIVARTRTGEEKHTVIAEWPDLTIK